MVKMLDEDVIERFREDMPIIRAFAGWTLENLAEMLGVSRATAIRLENEPKTMKTVHVYAINYLIAREMITNQALSICIDILRRDNVGVFSISRKDLVKKVEELKKTVGKKKGAKQLKEELSAWMTKTL
jgi:DNA-binding XRE family transcriptional regulator